MATATGWRRHETLEPVGKAAPRTLENMGLASTQTLATIFDGITRHSPEGLAFKRRAEAVGWKQAVRERDDGTYDWTLDRPINVPGRVAVWMGPL